MEGFTRVYVVVNVEENGTEFYARKVDRVWKSIA